MPKDIYGRDSALPDLTASAPTTGQLYDNSDLQEHLAARRASRGTFSATAGPRVRGGYGLYFNTNSHQNLIVTVTNPPATPRPVIVNPTFPNPAVQPRRRDLDPADPVGPRDTARARVQRQRAARDLVAARR